MDFNELNNEKAYDSKKLRYSHPNVKMNSGYFDSSYFSINKNDSPTTVSKLIAELNVQNNTLFKLIE